MIEETIPDSLLPSSYILYTLWCDLEKQNTDRARADQEFIASLAAQAERHQWGKQFLDRISDAQLEWLCDAAKRVGWKPDIFVPAIEQMGYWSFFDLEQVEGNQIREFLQHGLAVREELEYELAMRKALRQ